jgi:hypothetical protein
MDAREGRPVGRPLPCRPSEEGPMMNFKRSSFARSVMFAVAYEDGRTAYLVVENHGPAGSDYRIDAIARERQEQGHLPEGAIRSIKRVR